MKRVNYCLLGISLLLLYFIYAYDPPEQHDAPEPQRIFIRRTILSTSGSESVSTTETNTTVSIRQTSTSSTPSISTRSLSNKSANSIDTSHFTLENQPKWEIPLRRLIAPREDICKNVSLLVTVRCTPADFDLRSKYRASYGSFAKSQNFSIAFILGISNVTFNETALQMEAKQYGDILQSNFIDVFRNITLKTTSALKLHRDYCDPGTIMFRTDDDVFWEVGDAASIVEKFNNRTEGMAGKPLFNGWPMRVKAKWQVTPEEYPSNSYPTFSDGYAWFVKHETSRKFLDDIPRAPFLWLDDVFITGIVRDRLNVTIAPFQAIMKHEPYHTHSNLVQHFRYFKNTYNIDVYNKTGH